MTSPASPNREFAFLLNDVARLLRTCADQKAAEFGMTRAQWAVLARLDRSEGLKQCDLAEMLDLQPITLTRLLDRLAENDLIERRADPNDRRAKRLFLTTAARPLLDHATASRGRVAPFRCHKTCGRNKCGRVRQRRSGRACA